MTDGDHFIDELRAIGLIPPPLTDHQLADPAERLAWVQRVEATIRDIKALRKDVDRA